MASVKMATDGIVLSSLTAEDLTNTIEPKQVSSMLSHHGRYVPESLPSTSVAAYPPCARFTSQASGSSRLRIRWLTCILVRTTRPTFVNNAGHRSWLKPPRNMRDPWPLPLLPSKSRNPHVSQCKQCWPPVQYKCERSFLRRKGSTKKAPKCAFPAREPEQTSLRRVVL